MNVVEQSRITPGQTYTKHEQRVVRRDGEKVVEDVEIGEALVQAFVVDDRTGHDLVAYAMTSGPGQGRTRVCSLMAFAMRFRPVARLAPAAEQPVPEPPGQGAEAPPEKVAGHASKGNPWRSPPTLNRKELP